MRTLLCLSALLPALALVPACDGDDGSASETSGSTSTAAGTDGSGSSAGPGTSPTTATSGTTTTTTATATTTPTATTTTGVEETTDTLETSETTAVTETSEGSTGSPTDPPPPTDSALLLPWLEAGNYTRWDAEPARHPSEGPHFEGVRSFVNATLLESLEGGGDDHPVGSAVVKELFGAGPDVGGWAVIVKLAPGSSVDNWYWYEWFEGSTFADATGVNGCGNCHGLGVDFVRTTLPL